MKKWLFLKFFLQKCFRMMKKQRRKKRENRLKSWIIFFSLKSRVKLNTQFKKLSQILKKNNFKPKLTFPIMLTKILFKKIKNLV